MSILQVVTYPDERLRKVCTPVTVFDEQLRKLAADMFETMYDDDGVGLAGPQVGVLKRIVVMDVPVDSTVEETPDRPQPHFKEVLINPEIILKSEPCRSSEGCLSVPDYTAEVDRCNRVTFRYQDLDGNVHELEAHDLHAICVQHELDHLDGKLFIDKLSRLKRERLKTKYTKLKRAQEHR